MARVFPNLHKEIILGIPWLREINPVIDWTQHHVKVNHRGCDVTLLLIQKRESEDAAAEVNLCSSKHMAKQARRGHAIFIAIVRPMEEEEPEEKDTEGTEIQKMYHEEMPDQIKVVLQDY